MESKTVTSDALNQATILVVWFLQFGTLLSSNFLSPNERKKKDPIKILFLESGIINAIDSLLQRGLMQIKCACTLLVALLEDPNTAPKVTIKCCTKLMSAQITSKIYSILEQRSLPPEVEALLFGCLSNCASYGINLQIMTLDFCYFTHFFSQVQLRETMRLFQNLFKMLNKNLMPAQPFLLVYSSAQLFSNLSADPFFRDKIIEENGDTTLSNLFALLLTFQSSKRVENNTVYCVVLQAMANLAFHPFVQKSLLAPTSSSLNILILLAKKTSTPKEILPYLFFLLNNLVSNGLLLSTFFTLNFFTIQRTERIPATEVQIKSFVEATVLQLGSESNNPFLILSCLRLLYFILRFNNNYVQLFVDANVLETIGTITSDNQIIKDLIKAISILVENTPEEIEALEKVPKFDPNHVLFI